MSRDASTLLSAGETPALPGGRPTLVRRSRARCPRAQEAAHCCLRARRPRSQDARAPVMGQAAVCGRDARAPRRASRPREATEGTMPARPKGGTLLSAGETPAHPGDARTRTIPARQEHPETTARLLCLPRSDGVPLSWGSQGHDALGPVMGHTAVCGRDARAPRRCENAHHSSVSRTLRNDRLLSRQECILLIKIWHHAVYASEYD